MVGGGNKAKGLVSGGMCSSEWGGERAGGGGAGPSGQSGEPEGKTGQKRSVRDSAKSCTWRGVSSSHNTGSRTQGTRTGVDRTKWTLVQAGNSEKSQRLHPTQKEQHGKESWWALVHRGHLSSVYSSMDAVSPTARLPRYWAHPQWGHPMETGREHMQWYARRHFNEV